ncbi:MAG: hypothetical protein RSA84_18545 [Acinetobacter sp.]
MNTQPSSHLQHPPTIQEETQPAPLRNTAENIRKRVAVDHEEQLQWYAARHNLDPDILRQVNMKLTVAVVGGLTLLIMIIKFIWSQG